MDFYVLQPDGMMFGTKWAYGELIKPVSFGEAPMCPVCHSRPVASRAWLEPRKIRLSSSKPAKWGDLVWGAGFAFLVSGKMKHAYLQYKLTGIETFLPPVEIYQAGKKAPHALPDLPLYYPVQIELLGANINDIESEVLRNPHHCHYCRGDVISIKKVVVNEASWHGSDIFVARGLYGVILISDKFKKIVEMEGLTNIHLIPATEFNYDYRNPLPW